MPRSGSKHTLNLCYRLESGFWQDDLEHICRKARHSLCMVAGGVETLTPTNTSLEAKLGFSARERSGDWPRTGAGQQRLWQTWSGRRGRPRRRREADHQRLLLERETSPFGTRHYQQCPVHTENHHRDPRHRMPKARQTNPKCMRYHSRTQMMKLQNALRWMMRHQCRIQRARPAPHRPRLCLLRERGWKVTCVPVAKETAECSRRGWRQYDCHNRWDYGSVWGAVAWLGITGFQWERRLNVVHAPARCTNGTSGAPERTQGGWGIGPAAGNQASLNTLGGQRRLPHSQVETDGQRVWARADRTGELLQCDTTACHAACVVGPGSGSGTDCGSWILRSSLLPSSSSREIWCMGHATAGSGSATWTSLAATQDPARPEGGPAAWCHHATKVKEERYGLIQSARDPCVHSNVRERMWTMRHMDDYVVVGPPAKVSELTEDVGQVPGTRHAAGEISGLDAGTDSQWNQVDDRSTVDRGHCARLWTGKLDKEVCHSWCERSSCRRDSAGTRRALVLPNTSGTFVVSVSAPTLFAIRSGTACETCLGTNCLRSHCFEASHSIPVGNTRDEAGT